MKQPVKVGNRRMTNFHGGGKKYLVVITAVKRDKSFGSGWCVKWRVPVCRHCGISPFMDQNEWVDSSWVCGISWIAYK